MFERIILTRAEAQLARYRTQAEMFKVLHAAEYREYLPRIEHCYKRAVYWHGTGRYHYTHQEGSRYERAPAGGLLDVLDSILKHNGLTPHQDPWIDSGGKTVSLGTVRMHSRLFARIHLYEKDSLLYELGSAQYWTRLYITLLLFWLLTNLSSCRQFMRSLFRKSTFRDFQSWASALRKPENDKAIRVWDAVSGKAVSSDIGGNYPILFGINKGNLEVMTTIPLTHAVEVRSLQPVTLEDFTHVEVPLAKAQETREFLKSRDVQLEVLPLEFVDLYVSDVPLKTLAFL